VIVALFNVYLAILFVLVKLKIVPFNLFWKVSPAIVLTLLLFGLFIPMGWGAPQGPALVVRNSVAIVPDVAGEVLDVPVRANTPLKAGDVLFRIDPVPFESQLNTLTAQLKFQELRLSQMAHLQSTGTGRGFDVEQRQAEVDQLKAQVQGAQWNLDKTVVRAPADGYVTSDGVHRYVRDHPGRGDRPDRRPLCRARPARRADVQVRAGQDLYWQGGKCPASDCYRPDADIGPGRDAEKDRVGPIRHPGEAR
jgi:hypothetical protein